MKMESIKAITKNTLKALFLSVLIASCASSQTNLKKQVDDKFKTIAEAKYDTEVEYVKSPDGTYMLCIHDIKGTPRQPRNQLQFFIFDLKNEKVTMELKVGMGTVQWMDESHVEVFRTPSVVREGYERDDFITVYSAVDGSSKPKKAK